jgi:hypothetical protein
MRVIKAFGNQHFTLDLPAGKTGSLASLGEGKNDTHGIIGLAVDLEHLALPVKCLLFL